MWRSYESLQSTSKEWQNIPAALFTAFNNMRECACSWRERGRRKSCGNWHSYDACTRVPVRVLCFFIQIPFPHETIAACPWENNEMVSEIVALSSTLNRSTESSIWGLNHGGAEFDPLHLAGVTLTNQSPPTLSIAIIRPTKTSLREAFFIGHSGEACRRTLISFLCFIQVGEDRKSVV